MKKEAKKAEKEENEPAIDNGESTATEVAEESESHTDEDEVSEKEEKDELAEIKDRHLRLYSEFENFRRRTAKEKLEVIATANADLVLELLPVLDDFERAMKALDGDGEAVEGINLIYTKFRKTLDNSGLKEIEAAEGTVFDVEMHEAISQIPAPNKKLKGKVIDVVEKGYFLKDKVIRFAKVVVGS